MNELNYILLAVGVILIVVNLFINSNNIFNIAIYCLKTNTLNKYWDTFYTNCVSGRAIISSIFAFIIALLIFLLIAPFIFINRTFFNSKTNNSIQNGLYFQYDDTNTNFQTNKLKFITNINEATGLQIEPLEITGKINIDATFVIGNLDDLCQKTGKNISYNIMHEVALINGKKAIIPIFASIDNKRYPIYFIYNETHKNQFSQIKPKLHELGYKDCIYFSAIPI